MSRMQRITSKVANSFVISMLQKIGAKRFTTSDELWDFIIEFNKHHEGEWYRSGGCYEFATLLKSKVNGGRKIMLYANQDGREEEEVHELLEWKGSVWDIDGPHERDNVEDYYDGWNNKRWKYS